MRMILVCCLFVILKVLGECMWFIHSYSSGLLILYLDNHIIRVITPLIAMEHDDVIKWKHFPRDWPFVRGIHRSPVISPHKGQWRGALMFSLICVSINESVNNREAGDLWRDRAHHDVIVMSKHKVFGKIYRQLTTTTNRALTGCILFVVYCTSDKDDLTDRD